MWREIVKFVQVTEHVHSVTLLISRTGSGSLVEDGANVVPGDGRENGIMK